MQTVEGNIEMLRKALVRDGYNKKGDWYRDSELAIKFNNKSITLKSEKGTSRIYADPNTLTLEGLSKILRTSMITP